VNEPPLDAFVNQAAAELAFAKAMGWDDWTWDEETEQGMGMVRGIHVQWSPDPSACLVVPDDGDDDACWVLVTGEAPNFTVHGWITVRDAKTQGRQIGRDQ
jgi:hypothetical protein